MQNEEGNRWFVEMMRTICREQGVTLRLLSENWLMELRKDGKIARILGYTFDLNGSVASSIGADKVATFELLKSHDMPVIPHHLIRLHEGEERWNRANWQKGVVVKPLTGLGGRQVRLFHDSVKAQEFMESQLIEAWAASPLMDIVEETRLIMLDGTLLLAYAKQPVTMGGLKVFNLSRGALPADSEPSEEYIELAKRTQATIGLRVCAVDIVRLASGELAVLEVNSGITAQRYLQYNPKSEGRVREMYAQIVRAMFTTTK